MFADELEGYNIILASASPRRRQLLGEAGITFVPAAIECDEKWPLNLNGSQIAEYLAGFKSDQWPSQLKENDILITADTVVWCQNKLLGKPGDAGQAAAFLRILSDCDHEVITGICLRDQRRKQVFSVTTSVTFRRLTDEEIDYYIRHYKPFDKAGAYGIQEWIGLRGITDIKGSYYNVVGMPVSELYSEIVHFIKYKNKY